MSGLTEPELKAFYDWLHAEPQNSDQEQLAEECMTSRAHLSLVLNGTRRGKHTWKRVVKVLPMAGVLLLKQCPAWNKDAQAALDDRLHREDFARRFAKFANADGQTVSFMRSGGVRA